MCLCNSLQRIKAIEHIMRCSNAYNWATASSIVIGDRLRTRGRQLTSLEFNVESQNKLEEQTLDSMKKCSGSQIVIWLPLVVNIGITCS